MLSTKGTGSVLCDSSSLGSAGDEQRSTFHGWFWHLQTASRRRRIARGAGRTEVDVTNMIGSFSGMRSKMQSLSKMMKMGGGGPMCFPSYHS